MISARTVRPGAPELWGGIEATVNRIGNQYYDQLELSGHAKRSDDIERLAACGIRALRYPVLWEHHAEGQLGGGVGS